jgi:hypothetical protein
MTIFSCLRSETPQSVRSSPHIYILQEQGDAVIPPGTGFPFYHPVQLAGLWWSYLNLPPCRSWDPFVWSVKLLLAFTSTVIAGFSLLKIHDQDLYLLDMYVFRNGASSSMKEGSVFLCRFYICCTIVSAWVLCSAGSAISRGEHLLHTPKWDRHKT